MATVYLGNLSPEVTDTELREIFGQYGKIRSLRMISARGMAFIELKQPEAASAAVEALRGTEMKGRRVDVGLESSSGRPKGRPRGGHRRRR